MVRGSTSRTSIVGRWLRSHEEEDGPVRVYRPADHPFPPARGREGLRFDADGGFAVLTPGYDDRPGSADGRWRADAGDPGLITARVADQVITLRVVELTAAVLRLEWSAP